MPPITKITLVTITCGLLLAFTIFKIVYDHQMNLWKKDFAHQSEKAIIKLKAEMRNNERILLDIISFYDSSPKITRKAFKSYSSNILKRYNFIQALGWVPRVPKDNRKIIEELPLKEGFSNFQFTERQKQGTLGKASTRPEYYPIFYIEPLAGNELALGFNLGSESDALRAIKGSRESAEVLATNKISFIQSKSWEEGVMVFAPFYGGLVDRDRRLKGYIVGVYRLEDMVNNAINAYVEEGMSLTIFDGKEISKQSRLFGILRAKEDFISYKKEIKIFGRSWMVYFQGDRNFQGGIKLHSSIASASAMLLLSLLISIAFEINCFRMRNKILSENNKQLEHLSKLDALTGLANRRFFDESLRKELKRSSREKTSLSLILLDIDDFKKYNDTYGHLVGDECLKQIADVLQEAVDRSHDMVARFGGEEFAVIIPSADLKGGQIVAEKLRRSVEQLNFTSSEKSAALPMSISLGVSFFHPDQNNVTPETLIALADKALYKAKEEGKNRVVCM